MAEVNINAGGINAILNTKRLIERDRAIEFAKELIGWSNLVGAVFDQFKLLCRGFQKGLLS